MKVVECGLLCDSLQKGFLQQNVIRSKCEKIAFISKLVENNNLNNPEEINFETCNQSINNQVIFMQPFQQTLKRITICVPFAICLENYFMLQQFLKESKIKCITLTNATRKVSDKFENSLEITRLLKLIISSAKDLQIFVCFIPIAEQDLNYLINQSNSSLSSLIVSKTRDLFFHHKLRCSEISRNIKHLRLNISDPKWFDIFYKLRDMIQLRIKMNNDTYIDTSKWVNINRLLQNSPNLKILRLNFGNKKLLNSYDFSEIAYTCYTIEYLHLSNIEFKCIAQNSPDIDELLLPILNLKYLCLKNARFDEFNDKHLSIYIKKASNLTQLKIFTTDLIPNIINEARFKTASQPNTFAAFIKAPGLAETYCNQKCLPIYGCFCENKNFNDTYEYLWKKLYPLTFKVFKDVQNEINYFHCCPYNFFQVHKIIPNLYLSGCYRLPEFKKYYKFDFIIDLSNFVSNKNESNVMNININDDPKENIGMYFDPATNNIDDVLKNGKKVLVHSHDGISRSATIVLAYFLKFYGMSLSDALEFVTSKRNCINPNEGFLNYLELYEKLQGV